MSNRITPMSYRDFENFLKKRDCHLAGEHVTRHGITFRMPKRSRDVAPTLIKQACAALKIKL